MTILATGMAAWLLGHWIWAYKHALNAYSLPGLHHLAPIATNHTPRATAKWPSQR